MRKRNFWLTGIAAAAIVSMALLLGCPTTDSEDDPPAAPSPGFYVDDVLTEVSAQTGGNLLERSLTWLKTNAVDSGEYKIVLGEDITVTPIEVIEPTYDQRSSKIGIVLESRTLNNAVGVTLTLTSPSASAIKKIKLSDKGYLLHVGQRHPTGTGDIADVEAAITVVLENITLEGLYNDKNGDKDNDQALISVGGHDATVIMKTGSKITNNHNAANGQRKGGGLLIRAGRLVMQDGSIDTCYAESTDREGLGGAVCVIDFAQGVFTMNGGTITGNIAKGNAGDGSRGGAVFVSQGSFKMTGGSITRNHIEDVAANALGGAFGVWLSPTRVELLGGSIKNNTASTANGIAFPGLRLHGNVATIGGKIEIADPIVVSNVPFKVASDFDPIGQIQIDFNSAAPSDTYSGKVLLEWAEGGSGPLPVAKFKLGNYAATGGTTSAPAVLTPITGDIDPTTGVFTPTP
ncbi:hypothetical protein AGMMS4952_17940 [Spirochaetia bacterium]|nr:hypothetical protein AGMMS4952_17940 [Spirochaetia bacterium]